MRLLITGAAGFVGESLCNHLEAGGHTVLRVVRQVRSGRDCTVGDIGPETDWSPVLTAVDAVVHLAARVHVMHDGASEPLAEYRWVNVEGTLNLARQAAQAGVRRFVALSSIKVNGEGGSDAYNEASPVKPQSQYAISKCEAEQGLREIASETGVEVVLLRPPLVYGPGVGANFLSLMHLVRRGVPLPFGNVNNRRSLIYLGNLVDVITLCLIHPAAANQTYLLSDGEDVSTSELIRRLAVHMGRHARTLPVPVGLLSAVAKLLGKGAEAQRLIDSLAVDSGKIRRELGWRPPFTLNEGLAETVRWYQGQ